MHSRRNAHAHIQVKKLTTLWYLFNGAEEVVFSSMGKCDNFKLNNFCSLYLHHPPVGVSYFRVKVDGAFKLYIVSASGATWC